MARWILKRARRDAERLGLPVLHCQARDDCSNHPFSAMRAEERHRVTERLLKRTNIHYVGHMHGVLSLHVGMRVRLTCKLSSGHAIVSDAEGSVVDVALDPNTADEDRDTWNAQATFTELAPGCISEGVWVLMDKYLESPNFDRAKQMIFASGGGYTNDEGVQRLTAEETAVAKRLLYVERHTSFPFRFPLGDDTYVVTRTQLPLTHACVRTAQSTQGLTLKKRRRR